MKNTALNIRTTVETKKLIRKAATFVGTNISNFLIQSATEKAYEVLKEQNHLKLDDKQWDAFCKVLDRKPLFKPTLHQLLTKPSLFHD